MSKNHYDTLVIGSGPGGEGAAMKLSKSGQRVAVIENNPLVGGNCTHLGTIPSKALRYSIHMLAEHRRNPLFDQAVHVSYPQILKAANRVIDQQVSMRERHYSRNNVDLHTGFARFHDANTVVVHHSDKSEIELSADKFVIATGSRPYHPEGVDFSHPRVLDSDSILDMEDTPSTMIIYGAGVIGCEYASIFSNLNIKVNLINTRDRLLAFLDDEITDALGYHLREQGTIIRHNEEFNQVEVLDDGVVLHCESGKKFKADVMLWANGRSGNTSNMNLEEIGIAVNHRSQIEVNKGFQANTENIYAVGDVVGAPGLASASYDQGRFVATCIADGHCNWSLVDDMPTGIYTSPEISSVGRTEQELTEQQVPFEIGHALFRNIARAQITGHTVGMLKILFHRETLEILGIHCFGERASEIVHIGQAIMAQPGKANTLEYFTTTTFNFPTMAEAYRVAALDGLNRVF